MSKTHYPHTEIHRRMQAGESIPAWRPPEIRERIGLPEGVKAPLRHPEFLNIGSRFFVRMVEFQVISHHGDTMLIKAVK